MASTAVENRTTPVVSPTAAPYPSSSASSASPSQQTPPDTYGTSIELPGSFTVCQGLKGDGLMNTLDSLPEFEPQDVTDGNASNNNDRNSNPRAQTIRDWHSTRVRQVQQDVVDWHTMTRNNNNGSKTNNPHIPILQHLPTVADRWWIDANTCKLRIFTTASSNTRQSPPAVPNLLTSTSVQVAPGMVLVGVALHTFTFQSPAPKNNQRVQAPANALNNANYTYVGTYNNTNKQSPSSSSSLPPQQHIPKAGVLQYLQVESPVPGFILYSVDGYCVLTPGLPDNPLYTGVVIRGNGGEDESSSSSWWWWKVTCPAGAYVRQGEELASRHVATIPFGQYVRVENKIVNSAGLSRLRIKATLLPSSSHSPTRRSRAVQGWCSEWLNPLSGQRGPILQPLTPAVPVMYKVVLPAGACLRQNVELSSPIVPSSPLPLHSTVPILGRTFTEFPSTGCLPRLLVCPGRAYASLRLNKPNNSGASSSEYILQPTGQVDTSFDPNEAGRFHLETYRKLLPPKPPTQSPSSDRTATTSSSNSGSNSAPSEMGRKACVCCEDKAPNATIVHGETGHICCCLECARLCQANGLGCPICRLKIDSVILHFYA